MKAARLLCLALLLALLPSMACAQDLPSAVVQLPDDALLYLLTVTATEAIQRDLLPQQSITVPSQPRPQQDAPYTTEAPIAESFLLDLPAILQNIACQYLQTETTVSYDPPRPAPVYAPGQQLQPADTVWVSKTGSRYHTVPDCSGMNKPIPIPYSDALSEHSACSNCAWWLK